MKFHEDGPHYHEYELASGRFVFANGGVLGLGPHNESPTEGADGDLDDDLTPDERAEIAEEMVRRWAAWGGLHEGYQTALCSSDSCRDSPVC